MEEVQEAKKMNRLLLVGNGFDLAHGLKTQYNDFMVWYLKTKLSNALENRKDADELMEVQLNGLASLPRMLDNVSAFVDHFYVDGLHKITSQTFKIKNYANTFINPFTIIYKSSLLQKLINNCSQFNWVDIENSYFETLKLYIAKNSLDLEEKIKSLNTQWQCLIKHFENYLKAIGTNGLTIGYGKILDAPFNSNEFVDKLNYLNTVRGDTLILNFNYTSTIDRYVNGYSTSNVDINHIHGKLYDDDNELIFGFGDELDDDYLKFEHHKSMGQFDYIKSFWYFKTSNYYDLLRFIDSNDFQIYVLGHSCGLSDRTMLNMIFEHDNCKSIKIFYHGSKEDNNYTSITQEISRHFKSKPNMRRRIVSLDKSMRMPQHTDK